MKMLLSFSFFLLVGFSSVAQEKSFNKNLTLARCFELALQNSERIAMSLEAIKKAEGQYAQVLGKSLPELSFRFTSFWQDQSGLNDSGSLGSFTQSPQTEASLRLKLPLFTGYRELVALRSGASLIRQKTKEKDQIELLLFQDVVQSYYALLLAQENFHALQKTLTLTQKRLQEMIQREAVGRSRKSETLDTEAKIALLQTEKEESLLTLQTAKNLLAFFTGVPIEGTLSSSFQPLPKKKLGDYLASLSTRPDIEAKKEAILIAKGALSSAKSGHFPQFDLNANYYLLERSGFREPIDWDVNLGITVPIWSWGATQGAVKESKAAFNQAQKEKEILDEQAALEIKDLYEKHLSSSKKVALQERALKLTRQSFELKSEEYQHNLINNLEVLDALDRLYQTEKTLNGLRFQNILDALKLETSSGKIPKELP